MDEIKCRGYAGGVPIYCAHDKVVPIAEVKPNPKNPNQHPEEQIELLAKIKSFIVIFDSKNRKA